MDEYKSFLQVRDPSIVAWNRPKISPSIVRTNIFTDSALESEETTTENEHLLVYLRIKPTKDLKNLYEINDNTLVCHVPPGSQVLRNVHDNSKVTKSFTFTKIYSTEVTQTEIFNHCLKKKALDFINGRNSTIFTYGTSGSGKTYTILGTSDNPGIIPRALEYIFRTLPELKDVPTIKPSSSGDLIMLDVTARKAELEQRRRILNDTSIDKSEHVETYKLMQQRLSTEHPGILGNSAVNVGLWVSFAEIYNEYVYDLLVPDPGKGKPRPKLRLAQDSRGNTYVKDLKNVTVSSGLEAYEILQYGMQNLNYASTNLNSHSSRSHCIFTIKLVQWLNETEIQVSHFNFCDLAGSERVKNTQNVGKRLQESNNINTSLHVLGRCIESIRKSQKANDSRMIPYRDSKLTRLFQHALSGQESLTIIVNINSSRELFDESQHVLNFSAIAKKITMEKEVKPEKLNIKKRFSQYINGRSTALPSINESETDLLRDQVQTLYMELENMQHIWAEKENQIRRELMEKYSERINELRQNWNTRSEAEKQRLISSNDKKIQQLQTYYERLLDDKRGKTNSIEIYDSDDEDSVLKENVDRKPSEEELYKNAKRMRTADTAKLDIFDEKEIRDVKHQFQIKTLEVDQIKERLKEINEKNSSLQAELTQAKFECSAQKMELEKEKEVNKKLREELSILQRNNISKDNIIIDAQTEVEELEKEKRELEILLENKCIDNFELYKKVSDLTDQLNAQIAEQMERTEHVEELEEKLQMLE